MGAFLFPYGKKIKVTLTYSRGLEVKQLLGLAYLWKMRRIRSNFSLTFSSFFGMLSAFAGFIFGGQEDTNFEYLYIYTGLGGLIGGYLVSRWLIMKPNNYNFSRLIISGFTIGFVSPYVCWIIAFGFDSLVNKETRLTFIENPIMMLLSPTNMALMNLVFFGWLIIPLAILTLFLTTKIVQSKRPN